MNYRNADLLDGLFKSKNELTARDAVIILLATAVLTPVTLWLNGWALATLWGWFIAPVFGMDALSQGQAIGVMVTTAFVVHQVIEDDETKPKTMKRFVNACMVCIFRPLMAVLAGVIIRAFFL